MTFSAEDFAKALAEHDYAFQVGSTVRGTIINYDTEGVYVDIGGKAAALMPAAEASVRRDATFDDLFEIGEERKFLVIRDQDADGQVLLSVRRLELKQLWEKLQEMESASSTLQAKVTGTNKGGVIVDVEGLRGFVPRSHLSHAESLEDFIGQTLTLGFLEVSPNTNKLVLSQRAAARSQMMGQLAPGQLIEGTVVSLKPFGAFVEFEGVTGLLHIKQISKTYIESLSTVLQPGKPIKAVIVDLDSQRNRISLSTKVLEKYPGEMLKEMDIVMAEAENRLQDVGRVLAETDV